MSGILQELPRHEARGMVMVAEGLGSYGDGHVKVIAFNHGMGVASPVQRDRAHHKTIRAVPVRELQSLDHARPTARGYDRPIMARCTILGAGKLTSSANAWPICPVSHCI